MFKRRKINSLVHLPIIEISSEVSSEVGIPNSFTLFSTNADAAFEENVNKYGNRTFKGLCPIQPSINKETLFLLTTFIPGLALEQGHKDLMSFHTDTHKMF